MVLLTGASGPTAKQPTGKTVICDLFSTERSSSNAICL